MPKIKPNPMFRGISGKVGGMIFRTYKNGTIVASLAPEKSNKEPSSAQKHQRQKMKQANAYARAALQDPELRAYYEQGGGSPHRLAVKHYLRGNYPPLKGSPQSPS